MNRLTTLLFAATAFVAGCGGGGSKVDSGCTGATGCGMACELGNDKGVGRFCSAGGGECNANGAPILFCTKDYVPEAPGYCTGPCSKDEDCGMNAYCKQEDQGKGCEPMLCGATPDVDAGVDAMVDAH